MKTGIRVLNERVTAVVSADYLSDTYIEVESTSLPNDLSIRMSDYLYRDGVFILDEDHELALSKKEQEAKVYRNRLLALCDWTQTPDAPVNKAAWANYRQALRDITSQEGFPENVIWPVQPPF
jgi:hypothetical protein